MSKNKAMKCVIVLSGQTHQSFCLVEGLFWILCDADWHIGGGVMQWWRLSQPANMPYRGFCVCVVWSGVLFQAQARSASITHNALRICIMHQQALNIKLWMCPKIPRVVYVEKMALCCGSNLLTFCEAEQSGSCMVLHYWAPYAINVDRLKSPSLECLHVLMLPVSIKAVGYISFMFVNVHSYSFMYSLIHSFYCKYMHAQTAF